ncbi:MAG: alpha/beta fold hydrolase [Candidatus Brocadiia bacterium]
MRRMVTWFIGGALLVALGLVCMNLVGCAACRRGGTSVPTDPETGIMQGAEPVRIDRGRERACLLLHGWLTTPADFGDLPEKLDEAGWDVCAPVQAGHGTKPAALEGVTADDLLRTAREHYEELTSRYDRVALVGFSMGGTMATILAAEQPPDVLVLIAPFFRVRHKWYYVLPARTWNAVLSPVLKWAWRGRMGLHVNRREGRKEVLLYTAFPTSAADVLFELRRRALAEVDRERLTMPVLLVYSEGDGVCAHEAAEEYLATVPAAVKERAVFSRSDHHILHDHDREGAAAAVVEFLADRSRD